MRILRDVLVSLIINCILFTSIPATAFASEVSEANAETVVEENIMSEKSVESELTEAEQREQELFEMYGDDPGNGRLAGNVPESFYDENVTFSARASYKHNSKFNGYTIQKGIDVSHHQGKIDWKKVKAAGIEFAIIRVGYRGYGDAGNFGNDQRAFENMKAANEVGIPIGVYIYSQAITKAEAIAEANYALNKIKGYKIDLPVVMDYEYYSGPNGETGRLKKAKLTKTQATNNCLAFCETVEEAGYDAMVYANKSFLTNQLYASKISAKYEIWLAHYTTSTSYTGDYTYWQYTSSGKVNGITGNVDMNFHYVAPEKEPFELLVSDVTADSVQLKWIENENANVPEDIAGYELERKNSNGEYELLAEITDPAQVSYTDAGLEAGSAYTYRVRAFRLEEVTEVPEDNTSDDSSVLNKIYTEYSIPVTAVTDIEEVITITTSSSTFDSVSLAWKEVPDMTGYQVQRYNPSTEKYVTLKSVKTLTYKDTSVDAGITYKYRIRPYKTVSGKTVYGKYSDVKSIKTKSSVTGVTTTRVNIRAGASTSKKILDTVDKGTKLKVTGGAGDWYKLDITIDGKEKTGYISKEYVKIAAIPGKPSLTVKGTAFDKVKVSWKKISGASGYVVQRYNSAKKKYETIKTISNNLTISYTDTSRNCSTTYKYRVRAYKKYYGAKVYGSYSSAVSGKTKSSVKGKTIDNVNLRKGAGTSYGSYKIVKKNTKLTITGSKGNWYRVSTTVNGTKKNAYVMKKYVKL